MFLVEFWPLWHSINSLYLFGQLLGPAEGCGGPDQSHYKDVTNLNVIIVLLDLPSSPGRIWSSDHLNNIYNKDEIVNIIRNLHFFFHCKFLNSFLWIKWRIRPFQRKKVLALNSDFSYLSNLVYVFLLSESAFGRLCVRSLQTMVSLWRLWIVICRQHSTNINVQM